MSAREDCTHGLLAAPSVHAPGKGSVLCTDASQACQGRICWAGRIFLQFGSWVEELQLRGESRTGSLGRWGRREGPHCTENPRCAKVNFKRHFNGEEMSLIPLPFAYTF